MGYIVFSNYYETEFSRNDLEKLISNDKKNFRKEFMGEERLILKNDSLTRMDVLLNILSTELLQLGLEFDLNVDEYYEAVDLKCRDPKFKKPFLGCGVRGLPNNVYFYWYYSRIFIHPRSGAKTIYGSKIPTGFIVNNKYTAYPFKKFEPWVKDLVRHIEIHNQYRRERQKLIHEIKTLIKKYQTLINRDYY